MGFLFTSLLQGMGQGLLWALLAIGVYITFRILNFADLTADGSFALGGSMIAMLLLKGVEPILGTLIAALAGALAGLCTGLLNTKIKIPPILAGILTMTALYSINRRVLGSANKSFVTDTIIKYFQKMLGINGNYASVIVGILMVAIAVGALYWFFGTEQGSAIRATGNNSKMCRAQGINTDNTKIIALMISNALIAMSGALVAQQQTFGDITMGTGAIIIGLASVIIGEAFMGKKFPFWLRLAFVALGSVIYRLIITLVIIIPIFETYDIKLMTAVIVVIALTLSRIKEKSNKKKKQSALGLGTATSDTDNGGDN